MNHPERQSTFIAWLLMLSGTSFGWIFLMDGEYLTSAICYLVFAIGWYEWREATRFNDDLKRLAGE